MGFKTKLDVIIDVETVNVFAPGWNMENWDRAIFNVGITAVERVSRTVICSKEIGIDKIWSVPKRFIQDFYRKNFTRADFHMMLTSFKDFVPFFNGLLDDWSKEYSIQLWSYNAMFDSNAFFVNADREGVKLHKLTKDWKCIMMLTAHYLSYGTAAIQFCNWSVEQAYCDYLNRRGVARVLEFITPIGNVRTTAQNVHRFLSQNPEFIELHKGLADTECEMDILKWCQGHSGWTKVSAEPGIGWRLVNNAFEMGRNGFDSRGHLVSGADLTITNLEKVNELINYIQIQNIETSQKKEAESVKK